MKLHSNYLFVLLIATLIGCQHRPIESMVLADVALKAAQTAKADRLAPDLYRKAENYLLRARKDFKDGYFSSCEKFAAESRILSEKAEYQSLLKQAQMKTTTVEDDYSPY